MAHYILSGNTADITVFRYALKDVKGHFSLDGVIVVADGGVICEGLLKIFASLSLTEIAQAYKGLWRVEQAFQELKSGLEIEPCYHWTLVRVE